MPRPPTLLASTSSAAVAAPQLTPAEKAKQQAQAASLGLDFGDDAPLPEPSAGGSKAGAGAGAGAGASARGGANARGPSRRESSMVPLASLRSGANAGANAPAALSPKEAYEQVLSTSALNEYKNDPITGLPALPVSSEL